MDEFHMVGAARVRGRGPAAVAEVVPAADPVAAVAPVEPVAEVAPTEPEITSESYDYNASTGKFHRTSCRHVGATLNLKTLPELAELGAIPCSRCRPPEYPGYSTEK